MRRGVKARLSHHLRVRYGKGVGNNSCTPFVVRGTKVNVGMLAAVEQPPGKKKRKRGEKSKTQSPETCEGEMCEKTSRSEEVEDPVNASEEWDNRLYLEVEIEGMKCRALFDPGATCSLIGLGLTRHFASKL